MLISKRSFKKRKKTNRKKLNRTNKKTNRKKLNRTNKKTNRKKLNRTRKTNRKKLNKTRKKTILKGGIPESTFDAGYDVVGDFRGVFDLEKAITLRQFLLKSRFLRETLVDGVIKAFGERIKRILDRKINIHLSKLKLISSKDSHEYYIGLHKNGGSSADDDVDVDVDVDDDEEQLALLQEQLARQEQLAQEQPAQQELAQEQPAQQELAQEQPAQEQPAQELAQQELSQKEGNVRLWKKPGFGLWGGALAEGAARAGAARAAGGESATMETGAAADGKYFIIFHIKNNNLFSIPIEYINTFLLNYKSKLEEKLEKNKGMLDTLSKIFNIPKNDLLGVTLTLKYINGEIQLELINGNQESSGFLTIARIENGPEIEAEFFKIKFQNNQGEGVATPDYEALHKVYIQRFPWIRGDNVEILSKNSNSWVRGRVVRTLGEEPWRGLTIFVGGERNEKVAIDQDHVHKELKIPGDVVEYIRRFPWEIGDKVEIFSVSGNSWVLGEVIKVLGPEGKRDWLGVEYTVNGWLKQHKGVVIGEGIERIEEIEGIEEITGIIGRFKWGIGDITQLKIPFSVGSVFGDPQLRDG